MASLRSMKALHRGADHHDVDCRRARHHAYRLGMESLEDRCLLSVTPGTVTGAGTILHKQDSFSTNVTAAVIYGVTSYSGSLSFADTKAGDTFTAATITSVQLSESPVVTGPTTINGDFTITGTATLNRGTSATYNFTAAGSLPFPANAGSTGGVGFTVTGPSGFTYSQPWSPWDPGRR